MSKCLLLGLLTLAGCLRAVLAGLLPSQGDTANEIVIQGMDPVMEIIQCRMCHLQFPGEKCSRGRGICTATREEACMVGRMFKQDGTPWLTFLGCLKNCANVKNIKWDSYLVDFKCCRGRDLCNENI